MSVLARTAVEKHLETLKKQLASLGGDNEELKVLERRLSSESDPFVKALLTERVERLKKSAKAPNEYAKYADDLRALQRHLSSALGVMQSIPFYLTSNRGKKPGKVAAKTAGKRGKKG